MIKQANVIL